MMNKKKAGAYMGGGMAKKKKPMAATGYKEGGDTKKKETFGQAFKRNRKKFMNSGSAADYTFKHNGKSYNILQKGETKAGVMKKFSAPKTSLRPKVRPARPAGPSTQDKADNKISAPKKVNLTEAEKKAAAAKRKAIRRSSAASKTLGTDPAPRKESGPMSARAVQRKAATQKARLGPVIRGDGPMSARAVQRKANSDKVRAGQAKFRDRGTPVQLTLSQRNLRKFKKDPSSLTKIEKDRLFKTLKRQGVAIPKGLSGNNR